MHDLGDLFHEATRQRHSSVVVAATSAVKPYSASAATLPLQAGRFFGHLAFKVAVHRLEMLRHAVEAAGQRCKFVVAHRTNAAPRSPR